MKSEMKMSLLAGLLAIMGLTGSILAGTPSTQPADVQKSGEFSTSSREVGSAGTMIECYRIQAAGRPVQLRIEVLADGSNVDTLTDLSIYSGVQIGGEMDPLFVGADFQTPDVDIPSIRILNASGAAITNFPTTAVPEGGVIILRIEAGCAEYSLWLKGICTVSISGRVE